MIRSGSARIYATAVAKEGSLPQIRSFRIAAQTHHHHRIDLFFRMHGVRGRPLELAQDEVHPALQQHVK